MSKILIGFVLAALWSTSASAQFSSNTTEADYEAIFNVFMTAATEQNDVEAIFTIGYMYHEGIGVQQDHIEAVAWYHDAAYKGHYQAQSNLGYMYDQGIGVNQDLVEAYKWYTIAAKNGYYLAIENRRLVSKEMTQEQILEAQEQAKEWIDTIEIGCPDVERKT